MTNDKIKNNTIRNHIIPFTDLDSHIQFQPERQKILDEVLKILGREENLLLNKRMHSLAIGVRHAKFMVEDLKKK